MIDSKRASIFDDDSELDVTGFAPRPVEQLIAPDKVKTIAEAANFVSREPRRQTSLLPPTKPETRRHRTGRNIQLNIKATAHTIERFHKIADGNRWVLGDTFERAILALERELASSTS